jgi:signal transduction histidine kinase
MRWAQGVRARTASSATLVVAVALAIAFSALVALQRHELLDALRTVAEQQGADLAAQIAGEGIDEVDLEVVSAGAAERSLVQVVDADGRVLAASPSVDGEGPITRAAPGAGWTVVEVVDGLPIAEDDPFVVVTTGVPTPQGVGRVISAQSLESVDRSTTVVSSLLALAYPLILIVVGGTSYRLAARALAPVEAIRGRVAQISATGLGARVPVPGTGDEVAGLAETMNAMLDRLEESAKRQRRFVADASHELRSPLATIRGTAELGVNHPETTDWTSSAQVVLAETERLEHLVSDLLLLARSDESGLSLRADDVDLDDIVTAEVARLRSLAVQDVVVDVRAARVRGDAQHLSRAVRNLVDNAARHAATTITLRLRTRDGHAVLEVGDDGPGIDPADRERVFQRFVRLDDSRDRGSGGTGLGLAITREIAHAHGGTVMAMDDAGGLGACLRMVLPLCAERVGGQPPSETSR